MYLSDRSVFVKPTRARCVMDARTVGRAVRSGNHAEEAPSEVLAHGAEVRQHRHGVDRTRLVAHSTWYLISIAPRTRLLGCFAVVRTVNYYGGGTGLERTGGKGMRQRVLNILAAAIVATPVAALTIGTEPAAAGGPNEGGGTLLSFAQMYRRCDFSANTHTGGAGYARATAVLHTTSSEIVADVQIATAVPGTHYDVRLIQMPRSSATPCGAGDPGVAVGALDTDEVGAAATTVRAPIAPGATGAWLFVSRPGEFSQTPAEFYTTDFVAKI
jgi:hypothetical protein